MRWPPSIGIGIVCGLVGAVLAGLTAEVATKAQGVSNFEGGRAYLVVFIFVPLGFLVGLVVGAAMARSSGATGFAGVVRLQGLALLATAGIVGVVGGIGYFSADTPPTIDGSNLELELEVRIPEDRPLPEDLKAGGFQGSLHATDKDNNFIQFQFDSVTKRDGYVTIPGTAGLYSHSLNRTILVGTEFMASQVFDLPLASNPTPKDEAWTEWMRSKRRADGKPSAAEETVELRYRVRKSAEQ
ncbi:MAG: hypothetical protein ABI647_18700 [Gemmatimonadota bacterium]